jgi:hypothetical protein
METKLRAPHEQLIAAGNMAKRMLQEKGIEAKKSILDEITKTEGTPMLPGIPYYLPHRWTLKKAQQIMYDLVLLWKEDCKGRKGKKVSERDVENITHFFKFLINELQEQEKQYDREIARMPKLLKSIKTVPVLKDIFFPVEKRDTVRAIQRFFLDSLAVAIVLKNNHSTSEYFIWFMEWTEELHTLWIKKPVGIVKLNTLSLHKYDK